MSEAQAHLAASFENIRDELTRHATASGIVACHSELDAIEARLRRSWREPEPAPEPTVDPLDV